ANLHEHLKTKMITYLKEKLHTFDRTAEDMPGIDINIICFELNIDLTFKPVKQKKTKLRFRMLVNNKVEKLIKVASITEVSYPEWLANTVLVKEKIGKWRICVDFTDHNKMCPKDNFALPDINRLVEELHGTNSCLLYMFSQDTIKS